MSEEFFKILTLQNHNHTKSFSSYSFRCTKELNPFLNLDFFHMSMPTFPPHPHAGFSAITYLFKESQGEFQNRDSRGDESFIKSGGLHWTQAANGMMHEEIPIIPGKDCFGLQMFIKLPKQNELEDARAFHLDPKDIPIYNEKGITASILTGSFKGKESKLIGIHPKVDFLDIELAEGAKIPFSIQEENVTLIICLKGQIKLSDDTRLESYQVAIPKNRNISLEVTGVKEKNQFLFLSAKHLDEDYFWSGPFCMSSEEKIRDAKIRYQNGQMGSLKASF
jgi:redox-sensitive bicupin YhaK (pirin superfamily)